MKKIAFIILTLICSLVKAQDSIQFRYEKIANDTTEIKYFKVLSHGNFVISYPDDAYFNKIEGTVYLKFDIDSTCQITNKTIYKSLGYGLDEEALRFLDNLQKELNKLPKEKCFEIKGNLLPIKFKL